MDKILSSNIKSTGPVTISLFTEYLDSVRFHSLIVYQTIQTLFREKYLTNGLDLLIITDDISYNYYLQNEKKLFPEVPVVLCGITSGKFKEDSFSLKTTGILKFIDIHHGIENILKMLPKTKEIAVITGVSDQDYYYEEIAQNTFKEFSSQVKPIFIKGLSIEDTKAKLASLSPSIPILYLTMYEDGSGKTFYPREALLELRSVVKAPIFGISDTYLNYGTIGGSLVSFNDFTNEAARVALKILYGAKPSEIPIRNSASKNYFDWKELQQWGIKEKNLPFGSILVNKPPNAWDQYHHQIILISLFIILETLLIFYLIWETLRRKKVEKALKDSNENLEKHVEERTKKLEVINHELESFSYSVSHDLKAPIRAINGFSRLLKMDHPELEGTVGGNYLLKIQEASTHMTKMVDALLSLSKLSKMDINLKSTNVSRIANRIIEEYRKINPQRNVEFTCQENMTVDTDEVLIENLLQNLLDNAWKYTSKKDKAIISFGEKYKDWKRIFYISDNGAGFNMQYVGQLFGAFHRLHHESEFEGIGIGLATVKRIINRFGGEIWVESEIDKGCTFYFTLKNMQ